MMVSPSAGASTDEFSAKPVCSGPYQFESRSARDKITLKKYPGYWNAGEIGYDQIEYQIIPNLTVRLSRIQAGDLEVAERIAPTDLETIRSNAELALHTSAGLAVSHLFINVRPDSRRLLANKPELRKAFELSLDRNVINKVAFNGEFTADNQMIPPSSVYYSAKHPMPARNVDTAKKLIEAIRRLESDRRDHLRELADRRPRCADHPVDGAGSRLHGQSASA